nr:hypothetical protein CFP56_38475 [Quercus suber]
MTNLVKGYGDIHVFVEHLVNELVELPVEDIEPLAVRPPGSEPEGVNALEVFGGYQQNEVVVYCVSNDSELQSDHFYKYVEYEEDNDNEDDDGEYRPDYSQFGDHDNAETNNVDHGEAHDTVDEEYKPNFSQFGGHDNAETTNVDHGKPHEVDAQQVWARRAGKASVVDDQVEESSEAEGSDLEEEPQMQPMDIGEDSTDS